MPDPTLDLSPHPGIWLLFLTIGLWYFWLIRNVGPRHVSPGDPPATRRQIVAFTLGLLTLLVSAASPIHDLAEERLLSVHMVQHLLMSLVAPPLLLAGMPGWMFRWLFRPRWLFATVRRLSRPFTALLLFNAYIAVSHWEPVVNLQVTSELAHFGLHLVLLGTALLMWMPVLSPVFEIPRLRYPAQMMYLFAQSIVPTVPASFLTFADGPIYSFYGLAAPLIGVDPVTDQRIAGLIMKIIGGFILWGFITVLFFRWSKQDELTGSEEPAWQDVERRANRMEVG